MSECVNNDDVFCGERRGIPRGETETEGRINKADIPEGALMSSFTKDEVVSFSAELKGEIIYGDYKEPDDDFDAALVLGCPDIFMESRAKAAAKLYHSKRCKFFIVTGGVKWQTEFGYLSEAYALKEYLIREGVPVDLIVTETEALTTKDNMTFSSEIIADMFPDRRKRVAVVTSYFHITRAVGLAKTFVENADIVGVRAEFPGDSPETFAQNPMIHENVAKECRCLKTYVDRGWVEDFALF